MKDHLRFAVAYWHSFVNEGNDPFGLGVNERTWITDDPMETAKNRVEAAFEFLNGAKKSLESLIYQKSSVQNW